MMRTEEEIMELYNKHEHLIGATIYRRYSDPSYMNAHGITMDDLFQYGRLGLYQACRTFDETAGTKLRTHIISNVVWYINNESKKDSLYNTGNRTNELADKVSIDAKQADIFGESSTLYDKIENSNSGFEDFEVDIFLEEVSSSISEELSEIIKMRLNGKLLIEIGEALGVSKQAVEQRLKRNKDKIVELIQVG